MAVTCFFVLLGALIPQAWAQVVRPPTINGKPVPEIVATVNGTQLPAQVLLGEMKAFEMLSAQRGHPMQPGQKEHMAHTLLNKQIEMELFFQEANDKRIQVKPEVIDREFKNIRDQFPDKKLFLHALALQGLNPVSLKKKINKHLVTEEYLRQEIVPQVNVSDAQVEAFYKANKSSFAQPEIFSVRHIFVATIDSSGQKKAESPADQKKAERMAAEINQEARQNIEGLLLRVQAGEDFAALAKQFSEDDSTKKKGGKLGGVTRENMIPELAAVLPTLKIGETSEIIKSPYGFHIVKLDDIIPSHPIPLSEAKPDILNMLLKQETEKVKERFLLRLRKQADIKIFI